ncbi:MAG TPA: hypothetical protein VGM90_32745 [Kofleriaceae bacterium]|jgi:hypothetical protein
MKKLLLLALLVACSSRPDGAGTLRFKIAPPVWRVADREPLDHAPGERDYNRTLYHIDGYAVRRATRAMDVQTPTRAKDVNSFDEVPDSTWFTNRIGVRDISIDELKRGANLDPSPITHLPWTITGAKVGGTSIGFIFEDTTGQKFLLKFDVPERPEMETGAHAIGHRLVWAAGYNVPEDYVEYIDRKDLVIGSKASKKDVFGNKEPLTEAELDAALKKVYVREDGKIRVLASRFLPGVPIGPYAREGTRKDDKNDTIPHQFRRSVRGQVPLFSVMNHTDMQEDNTLDAFVAYKGPDGKPGKAGHVVHYMIDFGKAFGVMGWGLHWKTVGYTYRVDIAKALSSLLTLGLRPREWDAVSSPPYLGLGLYESEHYDPETWRPNSLYWPYEDIDNVDGYWGAKITMRFTPEQIEAVVGEAKFSDPRTARYMADTIIARQRKTGKYWFRQSSPLDTFSVQGTHLCFDDLAVHYQLEQTAGSRYSIEVFDGAGKQLSAARTLQGQEHSCVEVPTGATADAYTIVRLAVQRNGNVIAPVLVHLAKTNGALGVIGIRRL